MTISLEIPLNEVSKDFEDITSEPGEEETDFDDYEDYDDEYDDYIEEDYEDGDETDYYDDDDEEWNNKVNINLLDYLYFSSALKPVVFIWGV